METVREKNQEVPPQSYPWLVTWDVNGQCGNFFSISRNIYYSKTIPDTQNTKLCAHLDGWLVLKSKISKDYYLLNLVSMEQIQLPPLEIDYHSCFLTSSPSDSSCRMVFIIYDDANVQIFYCKPGDGRYIKQDLNLQIPLTRGASAAVLGGKIHIATTYDYTLSIISFNDTEVLIEQLEPLGLQNLNYPGIRFFLQYLVECDGGLLFLHKMYMVWNNAKYEVRGFRVMRYDFSEEAWEETNNIGGWTIFLSESGGMSCKANELELKRNSIYFLEPQDRLLHVFDIGDHSFSTMVPYPDAKLEDSKLDWAMMLTGRESK